MGSEGVDEGRLQKDRRGSDFAVGVTGGAMEGGIGERAGSGDQQVATGEKV